MGACLMELVLMILSLPWLSNEQLLVIAIFYFLWIYHIIRSCSYHLYYLSTSNSFRKKRKKKFPFHSRIRLTYYEPCIKYHVQLYRRMMRLNAINWGLLLGFLLSYLSAYLFSDMRIALLLFFYLISLLSIGMTLFCMVKVRRGKNRSGVQWVYENPNHKRW